MTRTYLSPPDVGALERELLLSAFDSNWIAPLGPHVDAFEREFAEVVEVPYAVALSSGTAALHLALVLLGVGAGDRVLVPTLTFAATANAVRYVGAEPVFVDCDRLTWNADADRVAEALEHLSREGRLPKAFICVDLYGQCADYERLSPVCERWGVPIVEDAAEALGATYRGRSSGGFGALGAFSFNGNKIITTSGGGMLVTSRKDWADRARNLASQAREPAPHYEHASVGYNYRLSNLLAAVGRGQLATLGDKVGKRREVFAKYVSVLGSTPGWAFQPESAKGRSTRWLTCAAIDETEFGATRDDVRLHLDSLDIEARPVWKPMHLQPVFKDCSRYGGAIAKELFEQGLCLPSGSSLTADDQRRVIEAVLTTPRRAPGVG